MKGVYSLGSLVPKVASSCWVAPNAAVIGNVVLNPDVSVWFGATIRGDQPEPITIGARTNIQDGSVLHSDAGVPLAIGNGVTVGHQAMLHGCTVGDNTLIKGLKDSAEHYVQNANKFKEELRGPLHDATDSFDPKPKL